MSRRANTIKADKPLPGAWLAVLAVLLETGTGSTADLKEACKEYARTTISGVMSHMHQHGFVQYAPGKQWGLTHAGIEAALEAEAEAKLCAHDRVVLVRSEARREMAIKVAAMEASDREDAMAFAAADRAAVLRLQAEVVA